MGEEDPLVDDSIGPPALIGVTVPLALALLCFSARIYTRVFPRYKLNASDYINSFAIFAEILAYSCFAAAIEAGFGRHTAFITPRMNAKILKLRLAFMLAGPIASTAARISTVYQIITLAQSVMARRFLWAMVGFLIAVILMFDLSIAVQCSPASALWNPNVPYARCLPERTMMIVNYTLVGAGLINDLAFAIIPTVFIWRLSRSRLERCLVSTLLSLGLCATAMAIVYIVHATAGLHTADPLRYSVISCLYCRLEEIFLLIASSVPFLKAPVEYVLRRLGAPGFQNMPRELASYPSNFGTLDSQELSGLPRRRQGLGNPKTTTEKNDDLFDREASSANNSTRPHSSDVETGGLDERRPAR